MNTLFRMLVVMLLYAAFGLASMAQSDPMNWTAPIPVEANDIFVLWHDYPSTGDQAHGKVYNYDFRNSALPANERIEGGTRGTFDAAGPASFTHAASGSFTTSAREQVVAAWGPDAGGIHVRILEFDTSATGWTAPGSITVGGGLPDERFDVHALDVDGDGLDEFAITYLDNNDSIRIDLYSVDSLLQPTLLSSFSDRKAIADVQAVVRYAITTGDLDGDGDYEIVLVRNDGFGGLPSMLSITTQVYDHVDGSLMARGSMQTSMFSTAPLQQMDLCAVTGHFFGNVKDDLFIGMTLTDGSGMRRVRGELVQVGSDLESFSFGIYTPPSIPAGSLQLAASAGDLLGDERDEIVLAAGKYAYLVRPTTADSLDYFPVWNMSAPMNLGSADLDQFGWMTNNSMHEHMHLTDMDLDGRNEIVAVFDDLATGNGGFQVRVHGINEDGTITLKGALELDEPDPVPGTDPPQYEFRPYTLVTGNFDGMNFTIGEPTHHVATGIMEPIVVLNAPPVHFDVFDGVIHDLNDCFSGNACDFEAAYHKQTTTSMEVVTTVQSDWATSSGLSASGSVSVGAEVEVAPLGVGGSVSFSTSLDYEAHMLDTYGEHFSNTSANSTSLSIGIEVMASEDDRIYSTITDYDVWEYPVYHGNETTPRNMIMAWVPLSTQATWFASKSYTAVDYVPDHEVGNILSYLPYAELDSNPNMGQAIAASYVNASFELDASSNYNWSLGMADFSSNSADTTMSIGTDVGYSIGPNRFDGDYSQTDLNTHTTSVLETIDLRVHLGSVNTGLGEVTYTVTPYAYWDKHGVLVVDYAARPAIAPAGFPATWWEAQYGALPNPTFVLPWKLDPEKGFALTDPIKRKQTKDIFVTPAYPLPDDTVTITARVRNFSLAGTPAPVTGSFYLGDPEAGGVPIIGLGGSNTISTDGAIPAQGRADLELQWVFPHGAPHHPRIFVVLDEDGTMDEVHETDNTGFNVMDYAGGVGVEELAGADGGYLLAPCFPNPFSEVTYIDYTLPVAGDVLVTVFDQMGRAVSQPVNGHQGPGPHRAEFHGAGHAPGVYYYSLRAGDFHDVRKMVLVR